MTTNPSCSGTPSITIGIGITEKAYEIISNTYNKFYLIGDELYFDSSSNVLIMNYILNKSISTQKHINEKKNNFYGFKLYVPSYRVTLPEISIPSYPKISNGCNDCVQKYWPRTCAWEKRSKKECVGYGKAKVCETIHYETYTKCNNEISFSTFTIDDIILFNSPSLDVEFSFQLIPEINLNTDLVIASKTGVSATIGAGAEIDAGTTNFLSLLITNLTIGLKIRIKTLRIFYGDEKNSFTNAVNNKSKGFSINNVIIDLIPKFDFCNGGKNPINIYADDKGTLSVYYSVYNTTISLYDLLQKPFSTSSDSSLNGLPPSTNATLLLQIDKPSKKLIDSVVNLLKKIQVNISMGLLLCPLPKQDEDVFLSFVITAKSSTMPFKDTNLTKIPTIPPEYTIPMVPHNDYLSDSQTDNINKSNQSIIQPFIKACQNEINNITDYINNTLDGCTVSVSVQLPIPLIRKK